ncbi:MAG: serine protease [Candidatus Rokuibacteriota bacterium]|nr:MAG: serine protease [Candidatus Rokubacteria bacterium]
MLSLFLGSAVLMWGKPEIRKKRRQRAELKRTFPRGIVIVATAALLVGGSAVALGAARARDASTTRNPRVGVVVVNTRLGYQGVAGAGTGIVLTSSGEVLTNNHVIHGATSIRVTEVSTGKTYPATVLGYSVSKDIAVLQLRDAHGLSTASIGGSDGLRAGDQVTAVGNAGGGGTLSVVRGRIDALGRSIAVSDESGASSRLTGLIETSARLEPGDSGGPLLSHGRVIGIDAAASSGFAFRSSGPGFAIPIDTAIAISEQVEAGQRSATVHIGPTAFLGVSLGPSDSYSQAAQGAIVEAVVPSSPADSAGLGADDVITSFGGHIVSSPSRLQRLVLQVSPGASMRLTWVDPYGYRRGATVRMVAGPPQ